MQLFDVSSNQNYKGMNMRNNKLLTKKNKKKVKEKEN